MAITQTSTTMSTGTDQEGDELVVAKDHDDVVGLPVGIGLSEGSLTWLTVDQALELARLLTEATE